MGNFEMSADNFDQFDQFDEYRDLNEEVAMPRMRNAPDRRRPRRKDRYNIISEPEVRQALTEQADDRRVLDFTYQASKSEAVWLTDALGSFFEGQWFDDVLQIIKGGKEASVYQLQGNATTGASYLAAKVYRPRMFRSLRNDHVYRENRANLDADGLIIKNEGMLKAISQRSGYGNQLLQTSWIEHEVHALNLLHQSGCDVPRCYASGDTAILMEYVGEADFAAPTLNSVRLERQEAENLFDIVIRNVDRMLAMGLVHADLSAYNILYSNGRIVLIDFPQVIHPEQNSNAYPIFQRDIRRVCEYFNRQGLRIDSGRLADELWSRHRGRPGPQIHPGLLDANSDEDKAYWNKYGAGRS